MDSGIPKVALYYDDDAYVEMLARPARVAPEAPLGLMGRQVAGKEFLDAYLQHGSWSELVAVVRNQANAASLLRFCQEHPSSRTRRRSLQVVTEGDFHQRFFPNPPARLLHLPCPPDPRHAWGRQPGGPGVYALSGVTHTLCSLGAVQSLCGLVTAPFEPFDSLICTSRAVVDMVRAATGAYADYMRERDGGSPRLRPRLAHIPLGVNTDRFRPPTPDERTAQRQALGVAADEVMILFVGRLSFHAKAHPFPMYHALAQAARTTGRKVHLVLAGWAVHPTVLAAFDAGARALAPGVRVTAMDGTRPQVRFAVWHAADIFTSLVDNIQETFGLVVAEAMASGLPVVASDWDGYRDLVLPEVTGFLVPTVMVPGATTAATTRLVLGERNYDEFLAECSQTVTVDSGGAAAAFARLIGDAALRQQFGAAGRQRALELFAWPRVIRAYEELWREQEAERQTWLAACAGAGASRHGPSLYPAPETSFAGYPTSWLGNEEPLQAPLDALPRLDQLLQLPLTNHSTDARVSDRTLLHTVLATALVPCTLAELDELFRQAGVAFDAGRATVAWLLKYDLLRVLPSQHP
jgi:glycosyltransferase involved in cell wall biosynthesis